jgi:hypothetical protein
MPCRAAGARIADSHAPIAYVATTGEGATSLDRRVSISACQHGDSADLSACQLPTGPGSYGVPAFLVYLDSSGNSNNRPNPDTHLTPPQHRSHLFVVQEGSQWEVTVWDMIQFVGLAGC